jgi:hypothetical protein
MDGLQKGGGVFVVVVVVVSASPFELHDQRAEVIMHILVDLVSFTERSLPSHKFFFYRLTPRSDCSKGVFYSPRADHGISVVSGRAVRQVSSAEEAAAEKARRTSLNKHTHEKLLACVICGLRTDF